MHEAEKRLSDSQLSAYVGELANVIVNGEDTEIVGGPNYLEPACGEGPA
jgi:hypothetical protein